MSTELVLSADEGEDLATFEETIASGLRTFVEVGEALAGIRERRLYRQTHLTFEAYCEQQWSFNASRARQMIAASKTVTNVTALGAPTPENEGQARELSGLDPEVAAEVMRLADKAEGEKLTAEKIRDAREQVAPRPMPGAKVTDTVRTETFSKAIAKADELFELDAERLGRILAEADMTSLDHLAEQITSFRDRARRARSGLRLVGTTR